MSKTTPIKTETRPSGSRKTVGASSRKLSSLSRLSWNLPSGESLASFALRFGFLAPPLLSKNERVSGPAGLRRVR